MKHIFKSLSLLFFILISQSCEKTITGSLETNELNANQQVHFENFIAVGEDHNNALDFYYEKLKEIPISEFSSPEKVTLFTNKTMKEYYSKHSKFKNLDYDIVWNEYDVKGMVQHDVSMIKKFNGNNINFISKRKSTADVVNASNFSPSLKNLLLKVDVLANINSSDEVLEGIESINNQGKQVLQNEELSILFSVTSIAKATTSYWKSNGEKWQSLRETNSKTNAKLAKIDWEETRKQDIRGAIAGVIPGAISGGKAGIVAGAGASPIGSVVVGAVGAATGAVVGAVGGAATASAIEAFASLFD